MLTIEGLRNGFGNGLRAEVARQHRRPCDGLQRGPVQARRQDERNHHQKFSTARQHRGKIQGIFNEVKISRGSAVLLRLGHSIYFSAIQTSVPLGSRSNSEIKSASARWMQPCDAGRPMEAWSPVPWM